MRGFLRRDESWFANVTDTELEDLLKSEFEVFAPSITRKVTIKDREYIYIEGFKFTKENGIDAVKLKLSHVGPVSVREDGELILNLRDINNNLEACREYIRFMDEKNLDRTVNDSTYPQHAGQIYMFINEKLKVLKRDSEPGDNN